MLSKRALTTCLVVLVSLCLIQHVEGRERLLKNKMAIRAKKYDIDFLPGGENPVPPPGMTFQKPNAADALPYSSDMMCKSLEQVYTSVASALGRKYNSCFDAYKGLSTTPTTAAPNGTNDQNLAACAMTQYTDIFCKHELIRKLPLKQYNRCRKVVHTVTATLQGCAKNTTYDNSTQPLYECDSIVGGKVGNMTKFCLSAKRVTYRTTPGGNNTKYYDPDNNWIEQTTITCPQREACQRIANGYNFCKDMKTALGGNANFSCENATGPWMCEFDVRALASGANTQVCKDIMPYFLIRMLDPSLITREQRCPVNFMTLFQNFLKDKMTALGDKIGPDGTKLAKANNDLHTISQYLQQIGDTSPLATSSITGFSDKLTSLMTALQAKTAYATLADVAKADVNMGNALMALYAKISTAIINAPTSDVQEANKEFEAMLATVKQLGTTVTSLTDPLTALAGISSLPDSPPAQASANGVPPVPMADFASKMQSLKAKLDTLSNWATAKRSQDAVTSLKAGPTADATAASASMGAWKDVMNAINTQLVELGTIMATELLRQNYWSNRVPDPTIPNTGADTCTLY